MRGMRLHGGGPRDTVQALQATAEAMRGTARRTQRKERRRSTEGAWVESSSGELIR